MKIRLAPVIALTVASLLCSALTSAASVGDSLLREDHPDQYEVQKGDTLWHCLDVSKRSLALAGNLAR